MYGVGESDMHLTQSLMQLRSSGKKESLIGAPMEIGEQTTTPFLHLISFD